MNTKAKTIYGDFLMNVAYILAERSCNNILWRKYLFDIYKFILSFFGMKVLPIITIADYLERTNGSRIIVKQNRIGVSICSSDPFETNDVFQMKLNDIYISKLNNVLIASGSDCIIDVSKSCIINNFCVNKSPNIYCSDSLLCREKENWGLVRKVINCEPKKIESGIMISGKFSDNYYHCLFENLNRCLLIDDNLIPVNVPIFVDKVVLSIPSLKKTLSFMTQGAKREIIPIETGKIYKCKSLYYINHAHYIIPHHRKISTLSNERSYFDPDILKIQREVLLKHKANVSLPTRIFLTRADSAKRLFNEDEVYNIIKNWRFEKVAPEKLPFEEQVALFNNAEYIIGGSGAAFSNIVFCKKGCKILCFRPVQSKEGTPLFKTIAYINDAEFWHYRADKVQNNSVHSNYYISPSKLRSVLMKLWGFS